MFGQFGLFLTATVLLSSSAASITLPDPHPVHPYTVSFNVPPILRSEASELLAHPPPEGTYELMRLHGWPYLCSYPPAVSNEVSQQRQEEQAKGPATKADVVKALELLKGLEKGCLYTENGDWWTYAYCHGHHVKQFHALPPSKDAIQQRFRTLPLPREDESSPHFILGKMPQADKLTNDWIEDHVEILEGDGVATSTSLRMKLDDGTICDLTGLPRRLDVLFECAPGAKGDLITHHKEIATCAYEMVVLTPRLCSEKRFLPTEVPEAKRIACHRVVERLQEDGSVGDIEGSEHGKEAKGEDHGRLLDAGEAARIATLFAEEEARVLEEQEAQAQFDAEIIAESALRESKKAGHATTEEEHLERAAAAIQHILEDFEGHVGAQKLPESRKTADKAQSNSDDDAFLTNVIQQLTTQVQAEVDQGSDLPDEYLVQLETETGEVWAIVQVRVRDGKASVEAVPEDKWAEVILADDALQKKANAANSKPGKNENARQKEEMENRFGLPEGLWEELRGMMGV
ncbi:Protein OS-9 [Saitoella coloradoensis]